MQTTALPPNSAHPPTCMVCVYKNIHRLVVGAASWLQSPLLLAVRLYWGWQFFETGKGKLMNHDKVTLFFQSLHIPFPSLNVYIAGTTECLGGLLLLIGLGSRLVSLPLIFTLIIAYLTAEIDSVKAIFIDPDKFVTAAPFLFLMACLLVLIFGPGKLSLDALIARKSASKGAGHKS